MNYNYFSLSGRFELADSFIAVPLLCLLSHCDNCYPLMNSHAPPIHCSTWTQSTNKRATWPIVTLNSCLWNQGFLSMVWTLKTPGTEIWLKPITYKLPTFHRSIKLFNPNLLYHLPPLGLHCLLVLCLPVLL